MAIDPVTPSTLYGGTGYGSCCGGDVKKSTDSGESWGTTNFPFPGFKVHAIAIDPLMPDTLYAGTNRGVFMSLDGGESWRSFSGGLRVHSIHVLAIDPISPAKLYAGTWGGGVYGIEQVVPVWR